MEPWKIVRHRWSNMLSIVVYFPVRGVHSQPGHPPPEEIWAEVGTPGILNLRILDA